MNPSLTGIHYGGHGGGLVLHLTVSDDNEDVEYVVALHHVIHGFPDDGGEAGWSTENNPPYDVIVQVKHFSEVLAGPAFLQADIEHTSILGITVPETVSKYSVELSEGLESLANNIDNFLIWIVDRTRSGV